MADRQPKEINLTMPPAVRSWLTAVIAEVIAGAAFEHIYESSSPVWDHEPFKSEPWRLSRLCGFLHKIAMRSPHTAGWRAHKRGT